ncbi:MAG: ATP-binding cassette domain-containing protein [Planctomycetes bacterium]|nr:ATP-binding cassette domain-containing protein [Planctomycetota bacterium]
MSIEIEHLTKRYGDTPVVDNVSLNVASGELFVLLGPSGSGKSTLLRMIAGLAEVDAGVVKLHGRDVTHISPKDRAVGFVFQHYALFKNMTVADNVEFALRVRKVPAAARRARREELLQIVGLAGLADRYPRQLSGGQQQRVALARALAHEPDVLLLDEPFGALDAKIRLELRQALRRIQREIGLTTVFVTHDQEEAFELADRMAVLRDGRLLEVGAPQDLYLRPRSPFVATFLGAANLMVGESTEHAVRLGAVELSLGTENTVGRTPRRMQVLFRPEDVEISEREHGDWPRLGHGSVAEIASIGGIERIRLRLPLLSGVRPIAPAAPFGADHLFIDAVRPQHEAERLPLKVGDRAWVAVRRFHVLAPASLRLLVDSGVAASAQAASELGHQMATRLDARVAVLESAAAAVASNKPLNADVYALDAETEHADEGFDVLVLGLDAGTLGRDLGWLAHVRHHMLLVPGPATLPSRFLVCVTVGEHGKVDVRFAERLAWQLGAAATVLTILPEEDPSQPDVPRHITQFMDACARALSVRGVVVKARVRRGPVQREIRAELEEGGYDLLVIGSPQHSTTGEVELRSGIVQQLIDKPPPCPFLVVRR